MLSHISAAVAQSVERRLGKAEVTGSIPVSSSFFMPIFQEFRVVIHSFTCRRYDLNDPVMRTYTAFIIQLVRIIDN